MRRLKQTVVWSPEAEHDLLDIWSYLAEQASNEVADRQLREIDVACRMLVRHPLKGRARDELVTGIRSLLIHTYIVFYRVTDTAVQIVRVLHGRRDLVTIFAEEPESER
jgi:toxin ParE1/3/4